MIEAASNTTVVCIDHAANPSIVNQTKFTTSSTDKLNLRLIRASTYLFQFQLEIKYRPGKQHIIPDALSRLPATEGHKRQADDCGALDLDTYHGHNSKDLDVLDLDTYHSGIEDLETEHTYAYQSTLIAISTDFKTKVIEGYQNEATWVHLLSMLASLRDRA